MEIVILILAALTLIALVALIIVLFKFFTYLDTGVDAIIESLQNIKKLFTK